MFTATRWSLTQASGALPVITSPDGEVGLSMVKRFDFDHGVVPRAFPCPHHPPNAPVARGPSKPAFEADDQTKMRDSAPKCGMRVSHSCPWHLENIGSPKGVRRPN